ncbi:universal stress protein [Desulfitobacterium sp.]|uniref:universal stress protein n=1 Tax=Desulfitobacterium sp. TaxID=49981 RepID=UPI002B1EFC07|nr:universal stress protein [Desulfitobacterium sp.]MEA4902568.1 universal stress protein [Desulfitobacterium sp.]
MFKKILVPTDGSENSRRAFAYAVQFARLLQAEIELLHVTFTPEALGYVLSEGVAVPQEQFNLNGEQALQITLSRVDTQEVPVRKKRRPGHPAAVILEEIKKEAIDLVVMGSRGFGPIAGSLLGSVSQRVLHGAVCPVLIVK